MSQNERKTKAVTNEVHAMINRSSYDRGEFFSFSNFWGILALKNENSRGFFCLLFAAAGKK